MDGATDLPFTIWPASSAEGDSKDLATQKISGMFISNSMQNRAYAALRIDTRRFSCNPQIQPTSSLPATIPLPDG